MSDFLPKIIRASTNNIDQAVAAAKEDNHDVVGASHLVIKNNEIVGYIGIATIPTVQMWMHTQKTKVRDSMFVQAFFEEVLNHNFLPKGGMFFMPTESKSPYLPYLKDIGYIETKIDKLLVKVLPPT